MATDHTKFFERQISLTERLEGIGHRDSVAMRQEDNDKRERLEILRVELGVPYDKPYQFPATAVADRTPEFTAFLSEHGQELCAIRVIPTDPSLPKLRVRGNSVAKAVKWFDQQALDPKKYRVDFVPHIEKTIWATTFVINGQGIFGEITTGVHSDLTQGLYEGEGAASFSYDFTHYQISRPLPGAVGHVKSIVAHLLVEDEPKRNMLADRLGAKFAHNYIEGYFETDTSPEAGLWFKDYNRILGRLYADFIVPPALPGSPALLTGRVGSVGVATGRVQIIDETDLTSTQLKPGAILVCRMTTPDYLPLMQQAAAIVTDLGGILSHAAIIARELSKPCLTATGEATQKLKNGMLVKVDCDKGILTLAD